MPNRLTWQPGYNFCNAACTCSACHSANRLSRVAITSLVGGASGDVSGDAAGVVADVVASEDAGSGAECVSEFMKKL